MNVVDAAFTTVFSRLSIHQQTALKRAVCFLAPFTPKAYGGAFDESSPGVLYELERDRILFCELNPHSRTQHHHFLVHDILRDFVLKTYVSPDEHKQTLDRIMTWYTDEVERADHMWDNNQ